MTKRFIFQKATSGASKARLTPVRCTAVGSNVISVKDILHQSLVQNEVSIVIDRRHAKTYRLYQSVTTTR
jgi:hypothetical protein